MKDGPLIAQVAALVGDPARANMLTALMDGRALTVTELAEAAGVALPTASGHLSKLRIAKLLVVEKQSRHRYYRLADHDVAHVLEALMGLAQRTGAVRVRTGPRDAAMRTARVCYDHLAGQQGVLLLQTLIKTGWLEHADPPVLTATGRDGLTAIGIDVLALERGRRPLCRTCLDWSERRHHLGGALGAAMLSHALDQRWARRGQGRVVTFSDTGARSFNAAYGL
ncbi:ArsR/SmtB family transcription factor [Brevundimonas sp. 2YAF1]|uniref:ArsR/SmtB family transcription factor n=1 Tax=Brevundimonas sp. 2YAF1 TaxID=3233024 RepID=UPI003F9044A1